MLKGSGGVLRVLRFGMGQALSYPLDERDETLLNRRQASLFGAIALIVMSSAQGLWMRGMVGR